MTSTEFPVDAGSVVFSVDGVEHTAQFANYSYSTDDLWSDYLAPYDPVVATVAGSEAFPAFQMDLGRVATEVGELIKPAYQDEPPYGSDIAIEWEPMGQDLVELQIRMKHVFTEEIYCVLEDDGVHTLSSEVVHDLGAAEEGSFVLEFGLRSGNVRFHEVEAGEWVRGAASLWRFRSVTVQK